MLNNQFLKRNGQTKTLLLLDHFLLSRCFFCYLMLRYCSLGNFVTSESMYSIVGQVKFMEDRL